MPRQSISLTSPNEAWLKAQVESEEFASKSEAINSLIREARKKEAYKAHVRDRLLSAEQSVASEGYSKRSKDERLRDIKEQARADGLL